ncbi:C6 transcription factor asaR [Cladobotryum mycophilum]|uniref:C6 transcription factor asaR n=1 Tax=Cladobotryum mycophilum TaxID=491253 RepID=A0ABR0SBH7_9HYPO
MPSPIDPFQQGSETEDSASQSTPPSLSSASSHVHRALTPTSPNPRRRPDRSCVLCHRRKIRCDRQTPCLACVRARLTCTYPPSDKPIRRVRKATIADVASRISDLEKTIVAASIDQANGATRHVRPPPARLPPSSVPVSLPVSPHESPGELKELSSEEVLVRNGSSSQYFNELLISRVIEEDQDKSSLLHTPQTDPTEEDVDSPFSLAGLLSSPSAFQDGSTEWRLPKLGAVQLWQAFVQNVDPAIKVLHIPTDEVIVFTAIHQPESASKDVMALVSAIYFAAAITLEPHEAQAAMGVDRCTALRSFKTQFQRYLSEADMLENPTVILLQGLAIYLQATRAYNHGRGIWILSGLAVRMALSIGLHRDGSKLGLPPFESEVRRRLWWHLLARDSRSAEDHGISSWSTIPAYDTKMPLNIDDTELRPDMKELPLPHTGWTRMSLPLVCMELAQTLQTIANLSITPTGSTPKEVIRNDMFNQLRARVELYIKPCNPVIPIQRMTMQIALCMVHKIDFVTRQQLANIENPDKRNSFATEENLISACRGLEIHLDLWADEFLRPYRWCMMGNPQYHILLYVLWHLCVRSTGRSIERAWRAVDGMFELERIRLAEAVSRPALKSIVLQRLRKKAELIRQSVANAEAKASSRAGSEAASNERTDDDTMQSLPQEVLDGRRFDPEGVDWNGLTQNLPDWNTLVEDLHMDLHDFTSYF